MAPARCAQPNGWSSPCPPIRARRCATGSGPRCNGWTTSASRAQREIAAGRPENAAGCSPPRSRRPPAAPTSPGGCACWPRHRLRPCEPARLPVTVSRSAGRRARPEPAGSRTRWSPDPAAASRVGHRRRRGGPDRRQRAHRHRRPGRRGPALHRLRDALGRRLVTGRHSRAGVAPARVHRGQRGRRRVERPGHLVGSPPTPPAAPCYASRAGPRSVRAPGTVSPTTGSSRVSSTAT